MLPKAKEGQQDPQVRPSRQKYKMLFPSSNKMGVKKRKRYEMGREEVWRI